EVLIALVIIAIALTAAIRATTASANDTMRMRTTATAHWVAMNVLSELQTGLASFPTADNTLNGQTEMLEKTWKWTAVKSNAAPGAIPTVTVSVSLKGHVINSVMGVLDV